MRDLDGEGARNRENKREKMRVMIQYEFLERIFKQDERFDHRYFAVLLFYDQCIEREHPIQTPGHRYG